MSRMSREVKSKQRTRRAAALMFRDRFLPRRFLLQPLQHRRHDQRQPYGSVDKHVAKLPAFRRRHKLAPRHRFAIRTARKPAPVNRFGADTQSIVIALQRQVFAAPTVAQFNERAKLLRPVPRHTSANRKNPQPLLAEQSRCEVLQVFKRIEAESRLPFLVALTIRQRVIETKL